MSRASFGQVNYEAYAVARGWRTVSGDRMPCWNDQNDAIKDGWHAGAGAVIDAYCRSRPEK